MSWSRVNKYEPSGFLLLQSGGRCLLQDNSAIIIFNRPFNIFSKVAKAAATTWNRVARAS